MCNPTSKAATSTNDLPRRPIDEAKIPAEALGEAKTTEARAPIGEPFPPTAPSTATDPSGGKLMMTKIREEAKAREEFVHVGDFKIPQEWEAKMRAIMNEDKYHILHCYCVFVVWLFVGG